MQLPAANFGIIIKLIETRYKNVDINMRTGQSYPLSMNRKSHGANIIRSTTPVDMITQEVSRRSVWRCSSSIQLCGGTVTSSADTWLQCWRGSSGTSQFCAVGKGFLMVQLISLRPNVKMF